MRIRHANRIRPIAGINLVGDRAGPISAEPLAVAMAMIDWLGTRVALRTAQKGADAARQAVGRDQASHI